MNEDEDNDTPAPAAGRDCPKVAMALAATSLLATIGTGLACTGPLIAILFGVGGFGWLTRYTYLQLPASLATGAMLLLGFYWLYGRRSLSCNNNALTNRIAKPVLWTATILAVGLNVFEYWILPQLG